MAFTKQYAKILAGMLGGDELKVFRCICGKGEAIKDVPEEVLMTLISLELVKRAKSIEAKPRELVLLTNKGQKVAEFV